MVGELIEDVIVDQVNVLVPPSEVKNKSMFQLISKSLGVPIQFRFIWNTKYSYYACDIITLESRSRVYPRPGMMHFMRGANPASVETGDLYVAFDIEEEITPQNITDLKIFLFHCEVVDA